MTMALKETEQPQTLRGTITESGINTFTAVEISVPRILSTREMYDADRIVITMDNPARTTTGSAVARAQLILSDDTPTALLGSDDPKMIAEKQLETVMVLLESAAGVFTVQKIAPSLLGDQGKNGVVDSTRWRNVLPDDKIWLVTHSISVTTVINAQVKIIGKLDKISQSDFEALVLSRL